MNVLQICHKPPVPAKDGGCLAMNSITQGLIHQGNHVKVLTISTPKHPFRSDSIEKDYLEQTQIESTFINTNLHPKDALVSLMKGESYNVNRFFDASFTHLIVETLKGANFDIVHLESIFVLPYIEAIKKVFSGKVILRTHNVEHLIWEDLARSTKNIVKKKYLSMLAKQLKKFELTFMNQVDGIAAISSSDKTAFHNLGITQPIQSIPFGIDISKKRQQSPQGFFFLGSLDWHANIEGVNWLSEHVASKLNSEVKIAGRNPSPKIKHHDKVTMIGEVENAKEFMLTNGIMLVPLFSGSGIRIKILEAMAWGVPVVATSKAVEGLAVKHQEHCMISDEPDHFIAYANFLFTDSDLRKKMIESARVFVKENYDKSKLAVDLQLFYEQIISG